MSVNRLIVVASIEGVRGVMAQISGIGDAAAGAQRQTALLGRSLGTLLGAVGVGAVIGLSDEFINLENRLKTVTGSTEELNSVMDRLYNVSQETRSSFDATSRLYQRVALAGRQFGATTEQNVRFTELLNKATIISGASTTEASAALIQLSQGMAKGSLNGDELRSVLEQLPIVGDAIAKKMNVTRGELRALGAENRITSKIVYEAVLAMDEWDQMFSKLGATVGQALNVLRNGIVRYIGEANKSTNALTILANMIQFVGKNFSFFGNAIVTTVTALAAYKTALFAVGAAQNAMRLVTFLTEIKNVTLAWGMARGIMMQVVVPMSRIALGFKIIQTAAIQAAAGLRAFALSNPFTALALALTVIIPLVYAYGDSIQLIGDNAATTANETYTLKDMLNQVALEFQMLAGPAVQGLSAALQNLGGVLLGLATPFLSFLEGLGFWAQSGATAAATTLSLSGIIYALGEGLIFAIQTAILPFGLAVNAAVQALAALGLVNAEVAKKVDDMTMSVSEWVKAGMDANKRIAEFEENQAKLKAELAATTGALNEQQQAMSSAGAAAGRAADAYAKLDGYNERLFNGVSMVTGGLDKQHWGWELVTEDLGQASAGMDDFNGTLSTFKGIDGAVYNGLNGIASGLAGVAQAANGAAAAVRNFNAASSSGGGGGGGSSSGGGRSTPLGSFSGLAAGAGKPFSTVISGATGLPISGSRASGGPVSSGKTYLVGEKGPELFTAAEDGQIHTSKVTQMYARKLEDAKGALAKFFEDQRGSIIGGPEVSQLMALQDQVRMMQNEYNAFLKKDQLKAEEKMRKNTKKELKMGFGDDGAINLPGFEDYNKAAPKIDFQTPTPWQQGYSGAHTSMGGGNAASVDNSMQIVVNINGVQDMQSFRQNRAQVEEEVRATVVRAMRRKSRR